MAPDLCRRYGLPSGAKLGANGMAAPTALSLVAVTFPEGRLRNRAVAA